MAAQPSRPDIAYPAPVFMLAGLATGCFPAVLDRAVTHSPEERDLVEKQTFRSVQGGHEIETGADSKHSRIHLAEPAEWAVPSPRHDGVMMVLHQKIRVGADGAYR